MFPIFTLLRVVFSLVSVILVIVTLFLGINAGKKLQNRAQCTGTIVGFQENTSPMFRNDYDAARLSPIVSFTVKGETYQFIARYADTSMKVGKQVPVVYNVEDPSIASIKTGLWLAPVITGSIALIFGILAIAFTVAKNFGLI
jgi:hypothetical protein